MDAPMTMNRVIHGAVRRDLDRLATALGQLRDGDRARAAGLARAFANLRRELTHHHEAEDTLVWPAMAGLGVEPDLLAAMESEHAAMSRALADTDGAMSALARTGSADDAATAQASLLHTRDVVDRHLGHEEDDLEPLMLRHAETPEWQAVERGLRRQPPRVIGPFFAWVTDGMSPEHRAYFRSTVPPPVVFVFTRLFGRRYRREIAPVWRAA
jgi:Hemerythrin HHE cation binding domain